MTHLYLLSSLQYNVILGFFPSIYLGIIHFNGKKTLFSIGSVCVYVYLIPVLQTDPGMEFHTFIKLRTDAVDCLNQQRK